MAKEIGYHKLARTFTVLEIRTWSDRGSNLFHECTLLKIKSDPYGIFFLRVISLDKLPTYFCLLPENINSIRDAEKWIQYKIYSKSELSRLCNIAIET